MVSDAITVGSFADICLYIIRHNYSLRSSLKLVNELSAGKKLPPLALVINGIEQNKGFNYGYGYGYGYHQSAG